MPSHRLQRGDINFMNSLQIDKAFPYSDTEKRYHTFDYFAKHLFGKKAARVSLDAHLTCPNKDGTCGVGGCLFCAGGSSGAIGETIEEQYARGAAAVQRKWGNVALIPYLQANTNTYGEIGALSDLYERCAALPGAVMLAIGTRADCLGEDVLALLVRISQKIPLLIELGMQSSNEEALTAIRRGYTHADFVKGYRRLREAGGNIRICLHLMNGLPGETHADMLQTAKEAARLAPDMVKIHAVCVLKSTGLHAMWETGVYSPLTMAEHVGILCDQLAILPPEVVIARICADAPRDILAAPMWVRNKMAIRNALDREMRARGIWQGISPSPFTIPGE